MMVKMGASTVKIETLLPKSPAKPKVQSAAITAGSTERMVALTDFIWSLKMVNKIRIANGKIAARMIIK